jgi:hypothetical protein
MTLGNLHEHIAHRDLAAVAAADDRESAPLHEQNRGQQALRTARNEVQIEGDEPLSRRHSPASGHVRFEALAPESHRIDADVHEDLGAAVAAQRDRMFGFRQGDDLPVAGRMQRRARGIHCKPIAQHPAGEDRVWNLIERCAPACQRREQDETARRLSCAHVAASLARRGA